MKKLIIISCMTILFGLFGCSKQTSIGTTPNTDGNMASDQTGKQNIAAEEVTTINYTNMQKKFSIEINKERNYQENTYNSVIRIFSPQNESDNFREDIGISTQILSGDTSLEKYVETATNYIKEQLNAFQLFESKDIEIDGLKAKSLIYNGKQGPYTLKQQQVFFIKDNEVYVITYTATMDTFAQYYDNMKKIVESFKFVQ